MKDLPLEDLREYATAEGLELPENPKAIMVSLLLAEEWVYLRVEDK